MGLNFISKVRDRVQKSWREGFDSLLFPLFAGAGAKGRAVIRAKIQGDQALGVGESVLIRLRGDGRSVEIIKGLAVAGHCPHPPQEVIDALCSNLHRSSCGVVRSTGQLLRTADVEVGATEDKGLDGHASANH